MPEDSLKGFSENWWKGLLFCLGRYSPTSSAQEAIFEDHCIVGWSKLSFDGWLGDGCLPHRRKPRSTLRVFLFCRYFGSVTVCRTQGMN